MSQWGRRRRAGRRCPSVVVAGGESDAGTGSLAATDAGGGSREFVDSVGGGVDDPNVADAGDPDGAPAAAVDCPRAK